MEFEFPIHPFIWDYSDMYNLIEFDSRTLNIDEFDLNILCLFLIQKRVSISIQQNIYILLNIIYFTNKMRY